MTLQPSKGRPYKAYVKKLNNGFGIKTINTVTGVENILLITADSINNTHSDNKIMDPQFPNLRPLLSKFSEETVSASLSLPNINKPNFAINKVLALLEPYLREIKPDIAGFHILDEGNTKSSHNVQETSVIFVANTELARKKGVHFNIPGKLMNVFFLDDDQTIEGKIKFKADSVVKPITIVVSDYVLHINICYDSPSKSQIKTVGTQTKKRYVLSSSVDDDKPTYKIESLVLSDLQVRFKQQFTQTDSSILIEEPKSLQKNLHKQYQDASIQTVFFKDQISYTSMTSSDKKSVCFTDKSGLNADDGNTKIDSLDSLKQTIDYENSQSSFSSYDSHEHILYQTKVLDQHVKDEKVYKMISIENEEGKEKTEALTTTDQMKEKKMFTLFDNSSNYDITIKNCGSMQSDHSNNFRGGTSLKLASVEKNRSELSVEKTHSDNGLPQERNIESSSNMSIKDLKERLNKTKLSLQQLYSVVDLLETKSVDRSSSETSFQTVSYFEREKLKNKSDISMQTSVVMTSQAASEESTSNDCSDQSSCFHETRLRTNQSNSTSDYEKSSRDYIGTLSSDILCEGCGSFHSDIGFEGICTIFGEKKIKQLDNKSSLGTVDCSSSSTSQENVFQNVQNVSSTGSILQDEIKSYVSNDLYSNETDSGLETKIADSLMSTKDHSYSLISELSQYNKSKNQEATKLVESDTDQLENGDAQKSPEESNQCLVDYDNKHALNKIHHTMGIKQSSERNFVDREECELDEISMFDHNLADFDKACKVDSLCSQTSREIKNTLNNTISSNENCISDEFIGALTESDNSNQNLTNSQDFFEENDKNPNNSTILTNQNIELMGDKKGIEEYNDVQSSKVTNTVLLFSNLTLSLPTRTEKSSNTIPFTSENKTETKESGKILYFTEVRNTKSWISFKKSLKSFNSNDKLGLKERTTTSEPTTNQQKTKLLSSGDHLRQNKLCKVSSRLEDSINTLKLFNNKSNFLKHKYSSCSTLHIIPSSSQELIQLKSQENSFQNREFSKKAVEKTESKSPRFRKWYVKSRGNCNKREDGNLANTIWCDPKFKFENKLVANKTDLKTSKSSKKAKSIKENKYAENKNTKHKKNKWFCFFIKT